MARRHEMLGTSRGKVPWLCQRCFVAEGTGDGRAWRQKFAIPSSPDAQCESCLSLPRPSGILASLARQLSGQASTSDSKLEIPRRRAYPLSETAALLGVSLTKVKDEIRDHRLNVVRAGKRRRVLDVEISRYLLSRKAG